MKKSKILFGLALIVVACVGFTSSASAKSAYIHYYNEYTPSVYAYREPTYTLARPHLSTMGYSVYGFNNVGNANAFTQMQNPVGPLVFVVHNHGNAGRQLMSGNGESIVGTNGNLTTLKAVSGVQSGSFVRLRIAILYGCYTGVTTGTHGDLPGQIVSKGAGASVAWKVSTFVNSVNEWNRLFFEKAIHSNIVESFRHADYWLEQIEGKDRADIMSKNRTERGNIYGVVNI